MVIEEDDFLCAMQHAIMINENGRFPRGAPRSLRNSSEALRRGDAEFRFSVSRRLPMETDAGQ